MLDSIETPAQPPRTWPARLMALPSRGGLIGAAGVFSTIVGGLMGAAWLYSHRQIWKAGGSCPFPWSDTSWARHSLTLIALSTAIIATVALAGIARSRGAPRRAVVTTYWIASLALWITLAVMFFDLWSLSTCERRA